MCGIVATFGKNVVERTLEQYDDQKHRGNEGYGFVALKDGKIVRFNRATTETEIFERLNEVKHNNPDALIFHHRWPTSTPNTEEGAHPLPIQMDDWKHNYYFVHNGVMQVNSLLVEAIEQKGYTFKSKVTELKIARIGDRLVQLPQDSEVNDSEALGWQVAMYLEGKLETVALAGSIAGIMIQEDKETSMCRVYAFRNYGNPLSVQRLKGTTVIASELPPATSTPLPPLELHRVEGLLVVESTPFKVGSTHQEEYVRTPYRAPIGYDTSEGRAYDDEHVGLDLRKVVTDDLSDEAILEESLEQKINDEKKAIQDYLEALLLAEMAEGTAEEEAMVESMEIARQAMLFAIDEVETIKNTT